MDKKINKTFHFDQSNVPNSSVHLLPCKIPTDDYAPVNEYFVVSAVEGKNYFQAKYRGRELFGEKIPLQNMEGFIAYPSEQDSNKLMFQKQFSDMMVWKREIPPSERDAINSWVKWPKLAEVIHASDD